MKIGIVWAFSLQQFGISTATWLFLKFDLVPALNVSCSFCRRWAEEIPGCGSERFERNEETKHQLNEQGKEGKPDQIGGSMGNWCIWCFPMFQTGFRLVSDPSQVSVVNF